jgi:transcriptional regulator with XRE-family HTH domain
MNNAFGELVRRYRRGAGLTLTAVAGQMGFTPAYMSDVERGLRRPLRDRHLGKLAKVIGIPAKELSIALAVSRGGFVLKTQGRGQGDLELGARLLRAWESIDKADADKVRGLVGELEAACEL